MRLAILTAALFSTAVILSLAVDVIGDEVEMRLWRALRPLR
jgi:hypothetical protein